MSDLQLIESFDGGDLIQSGNDLSVIDGLQNMVYLALFGGNIEQSTKDYDENEERFDYWGNSLLYDNSPDIQYNSETERTLNNVSLNSKGRLFIEQSVNKDLQFIQDFANISVSVSILGVDRVQISVVLTQPTELESNEFTYIWNATEGELENQSNINTFGSGIGLPNTLNFGL
jgi:phage gp46-like protein